MRLLLLGLGILASSLAALPAGAASAPPDGRLPVVATFSVLADMTRNVGGDKVAVTALVGPDSDVHVYQPTPSDARAVAAARVMVTNGLGLEGWLDRLRGAAGFRGRLVVASTGVAPLRMAGGRAVDPHAWQNLANGRIYVANIVAGLAAADPADADYYRRAGRAYEARLAALDDAVRQAVAAVPQAKRRVITTHDAFQYYGKAYGIEFLAPLGISTANEPSAGGLAALERQVRGEHVRALFLENVSDPRLIEQIARETGAVVGPPLYSDALSKPGEPASTYLDMLAYNTRVLTAGMQKN